MSEPRAAVQEDDEALDLPGGVIEPGDVGEPRHPSGIITSSGEAPTGGIPVGARTDRMIPDRSIPMSATGVPPLTPERDAAVLRALEPTPQEENLLKKSAEGAVTRNVAGEQTAPVKGDPGRTP